MYLFMFTIWNPVLVKKLEIIFCPRYAMYTLFTVIQESKFMREYIWYFGYYFA